MLNGGRGERTSAGCRVRCMHLALLLEFLLFSIGTASPCSRKEIGDPMVTIDNSLTAADKLRNNMNSYPALQEFELHSTKKDSLFLEVARDSNLRPGLLNVLRKFVAQFFSTPVQDSRSVETMTVGSREDSEGTSSTSRRFEPRSSKRRSSESPRRSFWAPDQQQPQIRNEGRRVLQETVSSPAVPQKQMVHMGPPAPPDLLNNEKQDWNQDYAEPDVHPPSSN